MTKRELTLAEIHEGTLEVLKRFISVCDQIGVQYFLAYGSLIGAVRHHGFIPWDDDLDIIMLRPDYEKFREYCNKHEGELTPFRFFDRHNTPDYPYTIGRFCDTRYQMVRNDDVPDAGQGMFIDIYPHDGAGNNNDKHWKSILKKKKHLMVLLGCAFSKTPIPSKSNKLLAPIRLPIYLYSHFKKPKYFLDKMEALREVYPFDKSKYVTCIIWDVEVRQCPKEWFLEYTTLPFEGIQVKVPKDYDSVLRDTYGDYMQLPPERERHPYHGYRLYRKEE